MSEPLVIGFPYVADRFGGSTVSSLLLARALQEAGHRVHVLTHGAEGRVADEALTLGLTVTRLPALSKMPGYARPDRFRLEQLLALPAGCTAIHTLKLDIVHVNDITMLRSWSAPAFSTGTAMVAHWRSNFHESWSVRLGLHIARAVIAVSRYSLAKLPAWIQNKAVVEYNSFDLRYSSEQKRLAHRALRAELGLPENAAIIGVFGNHTKRKHTNMLADVLAAVEHTADCRPVYGLACGARAEPYDTELDRKIAAFGLERRLIRPGFVRPVERWMAACDAIMAPAIDEPLARNVLEAQALGVPVLVSTDGGLKELIRDGENGLLCDPYDTDEWIAKTRALLDERARADRMAQRAREMVRELTPDRHARRVAAIYRGVIKHTRKAA